MVLAGDLTQGNFVERLFGEIEDKLGTVEILAANAGFAAPRRWLRRMTLCGTRT